MATSKLKYPPKIAKSSVSSDAMIAYIREFDKLNGLKSGSVYIINGKDVKV